MRITSFRAEKLKAHPRRFVILGPARAEAHGQEASFSYTSRPTAAQAALVQQPHQVSQGESSPLATFTKTAPGRACFSKS